MHGLSKAALTVRACAISLFFISSNSSAGDEEHHHEHPHEISEIVISADPLSGSDSHFSAPVAVLDGDALKAVSMRNIGEAVSEMPGVSSSDFGAAVGRPVIRGLGGGRVRVLENGIGSMDVSTISGDHAVSSEPIFAEQVEVLRGSATLLYGSGASGGLVNVVTDRIKSQAPEALELEAYNHYDTASDGWLSTATAAHAVGSHLVLSADALWRSTDDIDISGFASSEPDEHDRRGVLGNSNSESSRFGGGASIVGSAGHLGFHISRLDNEYGVPGGHGHHEEEEEDEDEDHEEEEEGGGVRIDIEQTRYDVDGLWFAEIPFIHEIKTKFGYNEYKHAEIEAPGEVGTRFSNDEWEGRIELILEPMGIWDGVLGFQIRDREFESIGEEAYVSPSELDSVALFLFEKAEFGDLHVDAGFRYEHYEAESAQLAAKSTHNLLAFSLGGVYEISDAYEFGFSASRTQRAPTIEELFAGGAHLATNAFEIGDVRLGEETSSNIDVFWRLSQGRLGVDVNFFYNHIDDFVFLESNDRNDDGIADRVEEDFLETGEIVDEDEALLLLNQRQTDAEFWGFELAADWLVFDDARGQTLFTVWSDYVEGELDDGSNVPRLPPMRVGSRIDYNKGPWDLRFSVTHAFEQDDTAPLETTTDSYTMLKLYGSYTWRTARWGELTVFARGSNLADEQIRRHTSFVKDQAPLPGISGLFGIRASF